MRFPSERDVPGFTAACVLSITQFFYLASGIFMYLSFTSSNMADIGLPTKYHFSGLAIVILILNLVRYSEKNRLELFQRLEGKPSKRKRVFGGLIVLYIVFSVALFFGLAIGGVGLRNL